jgi:alpha-ketoglutarate-dependent taurine dioxygenase
MGRYTLLDDIFRNGAVLLQDVPPPSSIHQNVNPSNSNNDSSSSMFDDVNSPVARLGQALSGGRLSHGQLYGDVFHVCDKTTTKSTMTLQNGTHPSETQFTLLASDTNIAYTTLALCPHQDLAYYESIPGLQLLHCIENDSNTVQGGASTLIDVIAAATVLQQLAPDLFDVLLHCDATFIKQRDGADMIYRRPHIRCSLSDKQIISVRWSPPFEGPLLSIPQQLAEDYYVAYSAFERMIDNALPRLRTTNDHKIENRLLPHISFELEHDLCDYANNNTWEYRMQRGDVLIFNNQRMLHGRRAYKLVPPTPPAPARATGSAGRHLMGCYTNIDDTLCQYRLLRRQHYQNLYKLPYIPTVGNGSSIVP